MLNQNETYKQLSLNLIRTLSQPGGSIEFIDEDEVEIIKQLNAENKSNIRKDGNKILAEKLVKMDNLIINASITNLNNAINSLEPANLTLIKYARSLIETQRKQFLRLTEIKDKIVSPVNTEFIRKKDKKFRNDTVRKLTKEGFSSGDISSLTGVPKATVARIVKKHS